MEPIERQNSESASPKQERGGGVDPRPLNPLSMNPNTVNPQGPPRRLLPERRRDITPESVPNTPIAGLPLLPKEEPRYADPMKNPVTPPDPQDMKGMSGTQYHLPAVG